MQPQTSYAKSGDVHIAYQVVGDGPRDLVLLPGVWSHCDLMWEDPSFARFATRMASFSRLIMFDKRGTGLSDRTFGGGALEERMEDVHAILDAVGSKQAVLFGQSEGGPMSILFSATYPGDNVGGIAVHIGARVGALAGPDEVIVSSTSRTWSPARASASRIGARMS